MVRYSRQDALSERDVVSMLQKTWDMDDSERAFETRLIIHCAARLGMRSGEIAHLHSSWISWSQKTIQIPRFQECTWGNNGDKCGYCRNRARDYAKTHEDVSFEEALEKYWNPKTKNAERSIPFDFNARTEICIEKFYERYDKFPVSKSTINRRIDRISKMCNINRVYPHSLRATAATIHASRNISPYSLMSVMGWQSMDTARTYISSSDESAARELRHKYK
jgi:integrase